MLVFFPHEMNQIELMTARVFSGTFIVLLYITHRHTHTHSSKDAVIDMFVSVQSVENG